MFVAIRDLRFARGRFALMGTVIVLITMLVGLLSGLTAGLGRQNVSAITDLPADQIAFTAPGAGQELSYSASTVTQQQWQRWAAQPGVRGAEPLGISTTRVQTGATGSGGAADGADGDGVSASISAAVSVFGVLPGSSLAPHAAALDDDDVVLSRAAATDLDLAVGDTLTLAGQSLRVAAVDGEASFSHTPVVWTTLSTWQRTLPPGSGEESAINTSASTGTPASTSPYASVIALSTTSDVDVAAGDAAAGTRTIARDDSLSAVGSYTSENGSLQLMRGFLFAISALVVGAFFTVWTIQRSGDVAVLKALGASTATLLKDALGQAVILLALGTAAGTVLAAGLGAAVTAASSAVPFSLTPATVLVPAAVIVVLGAAGAGLAIRRITSVDPLTALGSTR